MRLFAASLVVYSHSFVLLGQPDPGMLWQTPGAIGVYVFFAISGYLIAQSWDSDPHLGRFLTRRALRILPGLAVCILISVVLLGPALTQLPISDYFRHDQTWHYLRNIALNVSYHLPGVFGTNPFPHAVNGSLWSLPVEFSLYLLVAIVGISASANRWVWLLIFTLVAAACHFYVYQNPGLVAVYGMDTSQLAISGIYFVAGACFHKFRVARFFSVSSVVLALVVLQALMAWPATDRTASWILLPWITLGFGLAFSGLLNKLVRFGDFSYGVYIYAFPVQQTIVHLYPNIDQPTFLVASFAAAYLCAALSWNLIEKPALRLKPRRPLGPVDHGSP